MRGKVSRAGEWAQQLSERYIVGYITRRPKGVSWFIRKHWKIYILKTFTANNLLNSSLYLFHCFKTRRLESLDVSLKGVKSENAYWLNQTVFIKSIPFFCKFYSNLNESGCFWFSTKFFTRKNGNSSSKTASDFPQTDTNRLGLFKFLHFLPFLA